MPDTHKRSAVFRVTLTAGALLFFFAYRLYLIPARSIGQMLLGWGFEVTVFSTILLFFFVFSFVFSFVLQRLIWSGHLSFLSHRFSLHSLFSILFNAFFLSAFVLHFAFFFFFAEATWRRYSLLDTDSFQLLYFFTDVLPFTGWLLLIASLIILYFVAHYVSNHLAEIESLPSFLHHTLYHAGRPGHAGAAAFLALGGLVSTQIAAAPIDSPVAYIAVDLYEAFSARSLTIDAASPPASYNTWDRPEPETLRYKKIVVFVMESVTLKALEEGTSRLEPERMFAHIKKQSHRYTNIIASNMDSRTGMLAMLSGRFVPFEAYSDADVSRYAFLSRERSLVHRMNEYGYVTAFSAAVTEQEAVVFDLPWSERFVLTESDRDQARKQGFLCLTPYEFEHSCDDRYLLPTLVDFVASHERAFLYHEFIYGHSQEYMDALQIDPVRYYSDYVEAFTEALKKRDLLDETLIVIVADHGIRMKGYETERSTYILPLYFFHPQFQGRIDASLYAHFDFKDLLLAEASHSSPPLARDHAPFIGMTSSAIIGAVDARGSLTVIKDRRWRPYALMTPDTAHAERLLAGIRSYRDRFTESDFSY